MQLLESTKTASPSSEIKLQPPALFSRRPPSSSLLIFKLHPHCQHFSSFPKLRHTITAMAPCISSAQLHVCTCVGGYVFEKCESCGGNPREYVSFTPLKPAPLSISPDLRSIKEVWKAPSTSLTITLVLLNVNPVLVLVWYRSLAQITSNPTRLCLEILQSLQGMRQWKAILTKMNGKLAQIALVAEGKPAVSRFEIRPLS